MTAEHYARLRRLAFSIGYRMLGTVTDAEDLAQEVLARLHDVESSGEEIADPDALVATVATRLAIDHLRSARVRRQSYVGQWLPEPLLEPTVDAEEHALLADSLSMAFLVVLEQLSPMERAVFLLKEVFQYDHAAIARMVGTTASNTRQLLSRARRRLAQPAPRFPASPEDGRRVAEAFLEATERGDIEALIAVLAPDVVFTGDGGGVATAMREPVHGAKRVARLLLGFAALARREDLTLRVAVVNGATGVVAHAPDGGIAAVVALDIAAGRVQSVSSVIAPEKLDHLGPVSEALVRRSRPSAHP